MLFNYATRYRSAHNEIATPESFSLSDADYDAFKSFVEGEEFEFKTASEKALEDLVKTAKREKYYELANDAFSTLEQKLSHNNLKDIETFQVEIRQLLAEEIVNRYYFLSGRILAQIQQDKQIDKAVEVLNEPALVKEVLTGNLGDLAIAKANR